MLPNEIRSLIIEMKDSMELYDRRRVVHIQLRCSIVMWNIRWRLRDDLRYARFLLL